MGWVRRAAEYFGLVEPDLERGCMPALTQAPEESGVAYRRRCWRQESVTLRNLAVDSLRHDRQFLRCLDSIRTAIRREPDLWWEAHVSQFGLAVQKTLREEVSPDKVLGHGTWEDYWPVVVEAAVREEHYAT